MASLVNTTNEIRLILRFLGFSAFTLVLLYVLFVSGTFVKNALFPTPESPPEQGFGELPSVQFPAQTPVEYNYIVNTTTGTLPIFPDRVTVFKTITIEPSLVALQNARTNAENAGYTLSETKINDQVYHWSNRLGDRIEINILTGDFEIISNYANNPPSANITGSVAEKEGAFNHALTFLQSVGANTKGLSEERSLFRYLKLAGGVLIETDNKSEAQFVRIDLFQETVTVGNLKYGIFYPGFNTSTMYFILRSDGATRIAEAKYFYTELDLDEGSTYPIKTATEAFEDLKAGNAIFTSTEPDGASIDITDVSLGYYLGEEDQPYLLPIVIFEGVNFTGYVNALKGEIKTSEEVSN